MPVEPPGVQVLQDFMKAHFKKPGPSRVMRLIGEPTEWNYSVGVVKKPIQRVEAGGFFRKHGIFRVYVDDWFLQTIMLPGRSSFGLFSYDGEQIRYLSESEPSGFEDTLKAEARPLDEADPQTFGSFFCKVLLQGHDLIPNRVGLLNYKESTPFVYRVDRRELGRVAEQIRAPEITGDPTQGWRLEFTPVFGWAHEKQELGLECFDIDVRFRISRRERQVLSKRIFAKTPDLIY